MEPDLEPRFALLFPRSRCLFATRETRFVLTLKGLCSGRDLFQMTLEGGLSAPASSSIFICCFLHLSNKHFWVGQAQFLTLKTQQCAGPNPSSALNTEAVGALRWSVPAAKTWFQKPLHQDLNQWAWKLCKPASQWLKLHKEARPGDPTTQRQGSFQQTF